MKIKKIYFFFLAGFFAGLQHPHGILSFYLFIMLYSRYNLKSFYSLLIQGNS